VDQVVRAEIDQADLVDRVQVDQVVQADLVAKVDQVVQAEIVQADLVDLVRQAQVAVLLVPAHQVELQVAHRAEDQAVVLTQLVVVETQPVHLVNQVAVLQRVESQSAQSVKSSTT
jgi:hypothetical protein